MQDLIDIISCVLWISIKDIINHLDVIMEAAVGIVHYQQRQQQKH